MADTSIWIDYFNDVPSAAVGWLQQQLFIEEVQVADLILLEVLQGFRRNKDFERAHALLTSLSVVSLGGEDMAVQAAKNYRRLREKGVTARKTIDVLIGTYCIVNDLPLLYSDRDFDPMVKCLGLRCAIASH